MTVIPMHLACGFHPHSRSVDSETQRNKRTTAIVVPAGYKLRANAAAAVDTSKLLSNSHTVIYIIIQFRRVGKKAAV